MVRLQPFSCDNTVFLVICSSMGGHVFYHFYYVQDLKLNKSSVPLPLLANHRTKYKNIRKAADVADVPSVWHGVRGTTGGVPDVPGEGEGEKGEGVLCFHLLLSCRRRAIKNFGAKMADEGILPDSRAIVLLRCRICRPIFVLNSCRDHKCICHISAFYQHFR